MPRARKAHPARRCANPECASMFVPYRADTLHCSERCRRRKRTILVKQALGDLRALWEHIGQERGWR